MTKTTWGLLATTLLLSTACGSAPPPTPKAPAAEKTASREPVAEAAKPRTEEPMVAEDPDEAAIRELEKAYQLFATFIEKAGDDPKYAEAVKRARERMEDLGAMHAFLDQGLRERRGR
jgi:hypothetical protein